jgi:transposase
MDATPINTLPDDPAMLKALLARERMQRAVEVAARDQQITQERAACEQIKQEAANTIEAMKQKHQAEIEALLRRFYGPKSERFDPAQLLLFGLVIESMPVDTAAVEGEAGEKLVTRRIQHKHGRAKLPEALPRIPVEHDLKPEEKLCPCCGLERCRIGREITEQLEYHPASFKVLQHIRHKYACKPCAQGCDTCDSKAQIDIALREADKNGCTDSPEALATAAPIAKGLAGPGLLAHVITSKLGDHLPLYRLERIFARHDVHIARSTMCAWMLATGELVQPLVNLMATRVRESKVIHTDETRVPVQDETIEGKCKSGRIWTYIGDRDHPYIVYDYTPDRSRAGPSKWLDKFKGYLQADAYGGYDGIYAKRDSDGGGVKEVACWAHGRRHFFDAKDTDARRAAQMLSMVCELYKVEDEATAQIAATKDCTPIEADAIRLALRQAKSVPILATIKMWLDTEQKLVLPRSPMAQAMTYMLNQWDALCIFTTHGFLNIDNNAAERALRRVGIGRKNWLFAGHDIAAQRTATLYSLIASAERHGIDPQRYLTGVLARIASTPTSQLERLLPERWNAACDEAIALALPSPS